MADPLVAEAKHMVDEFEKLGDKIGELLAAEHMEFDAKLFDDRLSRVICMARQAARELGE